MDEARMRDAIVKLVYAYREGMNLSSELMKIFEDDAGTGNFAGLILDALTILTKEDNQDVNKTYAFAMMSAKGIQPQTAAEYLAKYIKVVQSMSGEDGAGK